MSKYPQKCCIELCGKRQIARGLCVYHYDYFKKRKLPMLSRINEAHGLSNTREHSSWTNMVGRCTNPNNPSFNNYGGRGITVCDEWRNSFPAFLSSMGPRPPDTSLDRINNDLGYFPENCRWATRAVQNLNSRHVRWVDGTTMEKFCQKHRIPMSTFRWHLNQGRDPHEIVRKRQEKFK